VKAAFRLLSWTRMTKPIAAWTKPDYGIDAPGALRNLFVFGALALVGGLFVPPVERIGRIDFGLGDTLRGVGTLLLIEALLFLLYVKFGKFRHRDLMLSLHSWRGDEDVLDVGCGRGLLLAGVAKHLTTGHATGLDIWSNVDMGANSEAATLRNLALEGITARCTLVSDGAQAMPFADNSFNVIVSNLCLHNIYDRPTRLAALAQIARVLKPGGIALISDYKGTGEYAAEFRALGFRVERRWGNVLTTFPPLRVVVARKPG
jgi:arsenite methyltransferase